MVQKPLTFVKEFYKAFTSGLTSAEIERLLSSDAKDMYAFYAKSMKPRNPHENKVVRFVKFCWYLFLAFLMKLTPGRRLLYAIGVILIIMAAWNQDFTNAFYAFLIMNFLLALELADKLITKGDLEFARKIQMSLLPERLVLPSGYSSASFSEVAQSVGGDYFDGIPLNDGSTLLVIGDVSGKGISAALYMVKVQTALHMIARKGGELRDILIELNVYLQKQMKRSYFLTISVVRLFPDGRFQFSRAGHMPALLVERSRKSGVWIQPKGTAIGLASTGGGGNVSSSDPLRHQW
ncbi:MAG: SpoIIE family protein phosphatase, partial [Bacteroidota bacterium]